VVSSLLRNITINLWGLGATIIGLQVSSQHSNLAESSCCAALDTKAMSQSYRSPVSMANMAGGKQVAAGVRKLQWLLLLEQTPYTTTRQSQSHAAVTCYELSHAWPRRLCAQSTVGTLVAKTLTTASSNPYAANPTTRTGAPAALDAFSIQVHILTATDCWMRLGRVCLANWAAQGCYHLHRESCIQACRAGRCLSWDAQTNWLTVCSERKLSAQASTNTVLAHFASIVFANWMLRLLQRAQQNAAPAWQPAWV
jgi:hypothetical protein